MTKPSKHPRPLRFEYGKADDGQFYWHIKSGNGEILAQGEGYQRRAGVLKVYHALFDIDKPAPSITDLNAGAVRKPRFILPKRLRLSKKEQRHFLKMSGPVHLEKLGRPLPVPHHTFRPKRKQRWVVSKIKPTRKFTPVYTIRWKKPAHYSGKLNRHFP